MNKRTKYENEQLNLSAENLLVDYELVNKGKDSIEKVTYNLETIDERVKRNTQDKKDILQMLRDNRTNQSRTTQNATRSNEELLEKIKESRNRLSKEVNLIENKKINTIDTDRNDYNSASYNREFAKKENINLENPFMNLYSKGEQVEVRRQLIEKFDLLELDDQDYLFATAAGLIAGFVDTVFVGTIGKGKDAKGLQKFVDSSVEKLVQNYGLKEKIASLENQKKSANSKESIQKIDQVINEYRTGKRSFDLKSSIRFLEKNHAVGYDTAHSKYIEGLTGMSPDNHHLLSLAHEPSLLGLIIGVRDQLTNTATFMTKEGKLINVAAQNINKELSGNTFEKIIQAINNWFGHIMSDIAGSSTSKGRGSGLPVPGWAALQKLQFGSIKLSAGKTDEYTIAEVSEWMFKNGYDVRAFTAELIPVLIYETLIRLYWIYKQHFYFGKTLKESFPIANNRELARLLLVGATTFSSVDVTHGVIKAGMEGTQPQGLATFIMTVNKPGLIDLGFRCIQNARFEIRHKKHVDRIIETDIKEEFYRVMSDGNNY